MINPLGLLITLYGLNAVAWAGMLFLLLCNDSPAMCWNPDDSGEKRHDCKDIHSPRRKWIGWDSQIINAFFCVTDFGLVPWCFRDLYYLPCYRLLGKGNVKELFGLRKLAGKYRSWARLPATILPLPELKQPDEPLTGSRAPPAALWKLDVFVWCQAWNTFLHCALRGSSGEFRGTIDRAGLPVSSLLSHAALLALEEWFPTWKAAEEKK